MLKKIDTVEQFEEVFEKENKFILLKHSLTCPISHAAYKEYQKFAEEQRKCPTYLLSCSRFTSISNEIAEKFQIKHESPQVTSFSNKGMLFGMLHTGKLPKLLG